MTSYNYPIKDYNQESAEDGEEKYGEIFWCLVIIKAELAWGVPPLV